MNQKEAELRSWELESSAWPLCVFFLTHTGPFKKLLKIHLTLSLLRSWSSLRQHQHLPWFPGAHIQLHDLFIPADPAASWFKVLSWSRSLNTVQGPTACPGSLPLSTLRPAWLPAISTLLCALALRGLHSLSFCPFSPFTRPPHHCCIGCICHSPSYKADAQSMYIEWTVSRKLLRLIPRSLPRVLLECISESKISASLPIAPAPQERSSHFSTWLKSWPSGVTSLFFFYWADYSQDTGSRPTGQGHGAGLHTFVEPMTQKALCQADHLFEAMMSIFPFFFSGILLTSFFSLQDTFLSLLPQSVGEERKAILLSPLLHTEKGKMTFWGKSLYTFKG